MVPSLARQITTMTSTHDRDIPSGFKNPMHSTVRLLHRKTAVNVCVCMKTIKVILSIQMYTIPPLQMQSNARPTMHQPSLTDGRRHAHKNARDRTGSRTNSVVVSNHDRSQETPNASSSTKNLWYHSSFSEDCSSSAEPRFSHHH